jgi:hypothetical protein
MVTDSFQVARVPFMKLQPVKTRLRGSPVSGIHQIPGDVDARDFSSQKR